MTKSIKQVSPTLLVGFIKYKEDGTKKFVEANPPIPLPFLDTP